MFLCIFFIIFKLSIYNITLLDCQHVGLFTDKFSATNNIALTFYPNLLHQLSHLNAQERFPGLSEGRFK